MKLQIGSISIMVIGILIVFLLLNTTNGKATYTNEDMALIIVSDYDGYDSVEMGKALAFYDYLIDEGFSSSQIEFLIDDGVSGQDGEGNLSNIEDAFEDIVDDPNNKEIIIYISDHGAAEQGINYLQFEDGNLTDTSISEYLDNMTYNSLTFITLGNHSGLFGNQLLDTDRVIMSSMAPYQEANPDLFNITRSLEDPTNDSNSDGEVDFIEAFNAEDSLLMMNPQDPEIWT